MRHCVLPVTLLLALFIIFIRARILRNRYANPCFCCKLNKIWREIAELGNVSLTQTYPEI